MQPAHQAHGDVERLLELDRTHVWHPFTQMRDWEADADRIVIASADGAWLTDIGGRRWLDGVASLWVQVHGHRHVRLDDAVQDQLGRVAHSTMLGLANVPATELAGRLVQIVPDGLTRVFYSDNGSTANEIAVKMAFQYWQHEGQTQKRKFLKLRDAYHGDTVGAVSVGGIDVFHGIFHPLLFETLEAPNPHRYRPPLEVSEDDCVDACIDALARILEENASELAAFIVEPLVQGAAGILTYPARYLQRARELCTQHDVLLIVDEVATGFGRTGAMFACEHAGISPDLMALGKGISGGYLPLSATLATEEIYRAFHGAPEELKQFFHGHTYTGNPLAAAACLASLDVFEDEDTIVRMQPKIEHLRQRLQPLADHPHVGDIRQWGFMVGIELVQDRARKTPFETEKQTGARACRAARERGVLLRPLGNVVVLMPPLCVTIEELDQIVDAAAHGIERATGNNA